MHIFHHYNLCTDVTFSNARYGHENSHLVAITPVLHNRCSCGKLRMSKETMILVHLPSVFWQMEGWNLDAYLRILKSDYLLR